MPNLMKAVWKKEDELIINALRADLARVTSERDEEVQSNVELREKLYNVRNDNDRLREAVGGMMKMWEATVSLGYTRSPMRNAAYAAAEAAIKDGK